MYEILPLTEDQSYDRACDHPYPSEVRGGLIHVPFDWGGLP